MGLRQRLRAEYHRERLFNALGGICRRCGSDDDLHFDCIQPCGDCHHKMSSSDRAFFYARQYRLGNLQLLCYWCHRRKTALDEVNITSFNVDKSQH